MQVNVLAVEKDKTKQIIADSIAKPLDHILPRDVNFKQQSRPYQISNQLFGASIENIPTAVQWLLNLL